MVEGDLGGLRDETTEERAPLSLLIGEGMTSEATRKGFPQDPVTRVWILSSLPSSLADPAWRTVILLAPTAVSSSSLHFPLLDPKLIPLLPTSPSSSLNPQ